MKIIFKPKTNSIDDVLNTAYARNLWEAGEGGIVSALEQVSGLKFKQVTIRAISGTFEDMHSGWPGLKAMALPLRYRTPDSSTSHYMDETQYVGFVSHELAHHLLLEHAIVAPEGSGHDLQAHQHIYLFLMDAWRLAYDREKAARLIANEPGYMRHHYITRSFSWARKLSRARRQEIMKHLVEYGDLPEDAKL